MAQHIAGKPSQFDILKVLSEHNHSEEKCYPTGASGVTVTGAAGAWTLGAYAEIVPVDTITKDFDIHHIVVEDASADDEYELVLYAGTTEIARRKVRPDTSIFSGALPEIPIQTPMIAKNSQIQAKVMSKGGGSDTITISIQYHTY